MHYSHEFVEICWEVKIGQHPSKIIILSLRRCTYYYSFSRSKNICLIFVLHVYVHYICDSGNSMSYLKSTFSSDNNDSSENIMFAESEYLHMVLSASSIHV